MELIACVLILEMHLAEADLTGFPTHQVVGTQIKHTAHVVVSSARTHLLSDFWWGRREAVGSLDTLRQIRLPVAQNCVLLICAMHGASLSKLRACVGRFRPCLVLFFLNEYGSTFVCI